MNGLCLIELEISFFDKYLWNASHNKNFISIQLADACRNTKLFLEEKITKHEGHAIETLITKRVFYGLSDRFVSNRTGDIIFFDKDQNASLAFCK